MLKPAENSESEIHAGKYFRQLTVKDINRNTLFHGNERQKSTENLEIIE